MFEGNLNEGELEIGQVSAQINTIRPVKEIISELLIEYDAAKLKVQNDGFTF
jgi:enoyl-[acyl-carrier protein] reductase II